jgi:hypothetical protein
MESFTRNRGRFARFFSTRLRIPAIPLFALVSALSACSPSTPAVDFALPPADITVIDLSTSLSCGTMVLCLVNCGLSKPACGIECAIGVDSTEALKATALGVCAALNCASGDAGSGIFGLLGCLLKSCPTEVAACDGLPHL